MMFHLTQNLGYPFFVTSLCLFIKNMHSAALKKLYRAMSKCLRGSSAHTVKILNIFSDLISFKLLNCLFIYFPRSLRYPLNSFYAISSIPVVQWLACWMFMSCSIPDSDFFFLKVFFRGLEHVPIVHQITQKAVLADHSKLLSLSLRPHLILTQWKIGTTNSSGNRDTIIPPCLLMVKKGIEKQPPAKQL